MTRRGRPLKHGETVAAKMRAGTQVNLLSPFNDKTPKGEALGYLTALLYLAPHTLAGGKTLCPHSTEACRAACLYSAGRGAFEKTQNARLRRTRLFNDDRPEFMLQLVEDLSFMVRRAGEEGLKVAVRLNGTSDVLWERETVDPKGNTLLTLFPEVQFYDYTRTPIEKRPGVPANYHLTYSLADDDLSKAVAYLRAGQSVAAVVPEEEKAPHESWFVAGGVEVTAMDGDLHDVRFLDPPASLVLLKPKGHRSVYDPSGLVQHDLVHRLKEALAHGV